MNELDEMGLPSHGSGGDGDRQVKVAVIGGVTAIIVALISLGGIFLAHSGGTSTPPTRIRERALMLGLTCGLSQKDLRPGLEVELTYHVDSPSTRQVGLGAGLYDAHGTDHSNGDGDISVFTLQRGRSNPSRPVLIPAHLAPGQYELDAEIWPPSEIGQNGVNDITDAPCTFFQVP